FGVAEVEEGIILRQAGVSGEILILVGAPEDAFDEVVKHGLTPVVFDPATVKALSAHAERMNVKVGVYLKIDVGMGRLGIMPHEALSFISAMESINGVFLAGLLGHFPMADGPDHDKTLGMFKKFESIVSEIPNSGKNDQIMHMANSAAIIRYPETHLDMVRAGISLYGCYPSDSEQDQMLMTLRPAMSFKTRVIQVKQVPKGYGLSYGHIYVTNRPSRIAVLPAGYNDGYLRKFSNRAEVLIRGRRAPIRGRVCMDLCLADVTDLPGVTVGDEVTLMGRQESADDSYKDEITANEVAGWLETNNYEVLCLFGNSNRKVYV
ncbi:MAG: alanine racemase, partial [Thermodesulfobacteriota bacterium]|nr:alanine racemase [Thermodesulfobacteriota bacterium]